MKMSSESKRALKVWCYWSSKSVIVVFKRSAEKSVNSIRKNHLILQKSVSVIKIMGQFFTFFSVALFISSRDKDLGLILSSTPHFLKTRWLLMIDCELFKVKAKDFWRSISRSRWLFSRLQFRQALFRDWWHFLSFLQRLLSKAQGNHTPLHQRSKSNFW